MLYVIYGQGSSSSDSLLELKEAHILLTLPNTIMAVKTSKMHLKSGWIYECIKFFLDSVQIFQQ